MKNKVLILLLLCSLILVNTHVANAFVYQGIKYSVPLGEPDADLLCGNTPICYVEGFLDPQMNNLSIPPDWVFDENNNAYWPIAISAGAFEGTNLNKIESLGTVQKIGHGAFKGTGVTSVNSLTVAIIEDQAFMNCTHLYNAQFAAVKNIGHSAFSGCHILATADFPLVNNIGDYAFANCNSLTYFYIPWAIQSIGRYAFYNSQHLRNVVFDGLTEMLYVIPEGCFLDCHDLQEFHIPNCVTRIEERAFEGCSSFHDISIHDDVAYIGANAFKGCTLMWKVYINGGGYIAPNAFANCAGIKFVRMHMDENTTPFYQIFPDANDLTTIQLKDGSSCIGKIYETGYSQGEFMNYTQLDSVYIPSSVKVIGDMSFYGCSSLKNVALPSGLEKIGKNAFVNTAIEQLVIPDKVTYLGEYAFAECSNLKQISFGKGLTEVPYAGFMNCTALKKLILPKHINTIGYMAFSGCTALEDLTIEGGISNIWDNSFAYCNNIKKLGVYIDYEPDAQNHVNLYNLFDLSNLEKLKILEGSKCLGTLNDALGTVSYLGSACPKLCSIVFPESLEIIGSNALSGCSNLKSIYLPQNVKKIGAGAFASCSGVQKITSMATTPPVVESNGLLNISRSIPLYVPSGSINRYKTASIWEEFFVQDVQNKPYDPDEDSVEAVEQIYNGQLPITNKVLINGQIYILRGDKIYTIQGQEVK